MKARATPSHAALALGALLLLACSSAPAEECARFEPATTQLKGTLVSRDFPGPPNYESVQSGDALERGWILALDTPLCVEGDAKSELNAASFQGLREVQLVLDEKAQVTAPSFLDRPVAVSGMLFAAHTGHHRTPVLLTVLEIGAADPQVNSAPVVTAVPSKLPTIHELWMQALVVGLIGLVISSVHFTTGMLALAFSLLLGWASVAILTDPFAGPAVIAERGEWYITAVLGSVLCQLALHGVGLGIGWWRSKPRMKAIGAPSA